MSAARGARRSRGSRTRRDDAEAPPEFLRRLGLSPRKALGQHFLVDELLLSRIADACALGPDDTVIEIGAGPGGLSIELAERARTLIAVEIDEELAGLARRQLEGRGRACVVAADALGVTPGELLEECEASAPYVMAGNLPYYITQPLIRRFLEADEPPERIVVLVQREVARRIVGGPGKESLLSLSVKTYGRPEALFDVPSSAFWPAPKVQIGARAESSGCRGRRSTCRRPRSRASSCCCAPGSRSRASSCTTACAPPSASRATTRRRCSATPRSTPRCAPSTSTSRTGGGSTRSPRSAGRGASMSASASALSLLAPAKLNLVLEVVGRRDDGYHDLDTVMTTIDLADRVRLRPAPALDVRLRGRGAAEIAGEGELSAAAARALGDAAGREPNVAIEVEKRVPPAAAGLGVDPRTRQPCCAGLTRLWELDWPIERLEEVAASVGSDVPFFLHGGTARCRGRGEIVEPLRDLRPLRLLLLLPQVPQGPAKTARRFGALHAHDLTDGERSARIAHRVRRDAPPPTRDLWNAFEAVIERTESELLAHYGAYAAALGGVPLHLTGTGPAVFLLIHERAKGAELRRDLEQAGAEVFPARTLTRAEALAITEES